MRNRVLSLLVLSFLVFSPFGFCADIPASLQINLLIKIFNFEKNLQQTSDDPIVLAVYSTSSSQEQVDEFVDAFKALKSKRLAGKGLDVIVVDNVAGLAKAHLAYIARGSDSNLDEIVSYCIQNNIKMVSDQQDFVANGIPLVLGIESGKPKIMIKMDALKKNNIELPSTILNLAKVL